MKKTNLAEPPIQKGEVKKAMTPADGGKTHLKPIPDAELEALVRTQIQSGRSVDTIFCYLRKGMVSERPLAGRYIITSEVLERIHRKISMQDEVPMPKRRKTANNKEASDSNTTVSTPKAGSAPDGQVNKDHTSSSASVVSASMDAHEITLKEVSPEPPSEMPKQQKTANNKEASASNTTVSTPKSGSAPDGQVNKDHTSSSATVASAGMDAHEITVTEVSPEPPSEIVQKLLEDRRLRREAEARAEAQLREIKEQRLKQIFEDMDAQMRKWCKQLAERKCRGEPWKNVSENKLKVLSEPKVDASTFDGEYLPPGATFGVDEVYAPSKEGPRWLRLTTGGWVSTHSRKPGRENKVVAKRAPHHADPPNEVVFRIGAEEDRREAYLRMVHRKSEGELRLPDGLKVDLMPYQVEGVEWLVSLFNNDLAGLLADEMGLGKTIQTLALIAFLKETKKRYGPHLVICPKSVIANWQREVQRCYPEYQEHVMLFQGTPAERENLSKNLRKQLKKSKKKLLVITNYEQIHPERNTVLHEPRWEMIIIDEGHRMKNQKSVFHQTMKEHFNARMKLLLTGTPLQNNLDELFSLLNYLLPEIFTSASSFKSWFAAPFLGQLESMSMSEYSVDFTEEEEKTLISNLHAMLAPFVLQRTKADVLSLEALPPRKEVILRIPLSSWQKKTYQSIKDRTLRRLADGGGVSHQMLRNTTMQLRKIALHPYLFGRGTGKRSLEDIVRSSGKVEALDRLLRKLHAFGHKVLVFSQFTSMLDILEEFLELRGWSAERIDGQVSAEERQARINRFSHPNSKGFVFLLSARAGAVGLNLQAADTVVLFDLDWNPQNDKQAIARAHRFGQTKEVLVVRMLSTSAVEAHMEQRAEEKLDLEKKIIGAGGFSKKGTAKTPEERSAHLHELFGTLSGSKALNSQFTPTTLDQANEMLARSKEELTSFQAEDAACGLNAPQAQKSTQTHSCVEETLLNMLVQSGRLMADHEAPEEFEALEDEDDDGDSE